MNYKRLVSRQKKLDKTLLKGFSNLSESKMIDLVKKIDSLTIILVNMKKEYEDNYNETIVFYNSKVYISTREQNS